MASSAGGARSTAAGTAQRRRRREDGTVSGGSRATDVRLQVPGSPGAEEPTEAAKVYFHKDEHLQFWFPGEWLVGQLRCKPGLLAGGTPLVNFEGTARVKRTGEIGLGNPDHISYVCNVDVGERGQLEQHASSANTYRFKVQIPEQAAPGVAMPPTCKFTGDAFFECEIAYILRISFVESPVADVEVPVKVRTALSREEEDRLEPQHEAKMTARVASCCCLQRGEMDLRLWVDRPLCISGAAVPIKLQVTNRSPKKIKGLRIVLEAKFWAAHGDDRRQDSFTLAEVQLERELIKPAGDGAEDQRIDVTMRLPHRAPPTFRYGNRMELVHRVVIDPLWVADFEIKCEYPVAQCLEYLMRQNIIESGGASDSGRDSDGTGGGGGARAERRRSSRRSARPDERRRSSSRGQAIDTGEVQLAVPGGDSPVAGAAEAAGPPDADDEG